MSYLNIRNVYILALHQTYIEKDMQSLPQWRCNKKNGIWRLHCGYMEAREDDF